MPTIDLEQIPVNQTLANRRTTADWIADSLRDAINSGLLTDGTQLNQASLATRFNVSRVPVREAMRQLQAEGLVELRAHQIAVVRGLDVDHLEEVYGLRALLEAHLLRQSADVLTPDDLDRAERINSRLFEDLPHEEWLELNSQFHQALYEPSGATMTLDILGQLRARVERYSRMWAKGRDVHRPLIAAGEHRDIIWLLREGQVERACEALQNHVLHTKNAVLAVGQAMSEDRR